MVELLLVEPLTSIEMLIMTLRDSGSGDIDNIIFDGNHNHMLTGDSETRMKNLAVNMFVKVNNDCN